MDWTDLITKFFDQSFASRWNGTCSGWTKELVIAHIISDILIWLAYTTIPILLIKFAKHKKDLPFNLLFFLFAMFITSCGMTHLMNVITAFFPYYYMDFWIKTLAAVTSVSTTWMLWKTKLPNPFTALAVIEKINKELENANKELDNFALVAAHDLQDPLKQNLVFARLMQQGKMEFASEMIENNLRMQNFIKNLLTFARSGGTNLNIETVSIKTLLDDVINDLGAMITDSKAKIIIGNMPTLKCDCVQISRVFQNLLKNAIKCRAERPLTIEITAEKTKDSWLFSVKDNGIGIPKNMMSNLFTFYRGKKVGFGLAICKRIVESHGGFIQAESEDKGALFVFTISHELPLM